MTDANTYFDELHERSNQTCELCGAVDNLQAILVPPSQNSVNGCAMVCSVCNGQITGNDALNLNHLRCLTEAAWSEVPAVQVLVWRMLNRLTDEAWATDLLEQMYLDDEVQAWAEAEAVEQAVEAGAPTLDSNGTALAEGDSVTLIKDLDVKGTTFVAKRGTVVKNIHLTDNPEHIEGRVNKTKLVLKTCFLKKVN